MSSFAENEIDILDDYISDEFRGGMKAGFDRDSLTKASSLENIGPEAERDQLKRISLARKRLVSFFDDPRVKERHDRLRQIVDEMSKGNFPSALTKLNELEKFAGVTFFFDLVNPFNSLPVDFFTIRLVKNPVPGKPPIEQTKPGTIPAYVGPKPSDIAGQRLVALNDFLFKGPEHRFRMDLLQAEINAGLRNFGEAISVYDKLLAATPFGSPRHKFIAIRSAYAHLALGDQLFRKHRVLSDQDRQTITDSYDDAVRLVQEKSVSPDNPLRQEVEAHASLQKAKLQSNLNFLGLWDAFVPVQTLATLQQAALTQIQAAKASVAAFKEFLEKAEQDKEKQMDLQSQIAEETFSLDIIERKRAIATLGIDKIDEQLADFDRQQNVLVRETVLGGFRAVLGAGESGPKAAFGLVTNMLSFDDQSEQLAHQSRWQR